MSADYVDCPICKSCDTRRDKADTGYIYQCTNLNCGSNNGINLANLLSNLPKAIAKVDYEELISKKVIPETRDNPSFAKYFRFKKKEYIKYANLIMKEIK